MECDSHLCDGGCCRASDGFPPANEELVGLLDRLCSSVVSAGCASPTRARNEAEIVRRFWRRETKALQQCQTRLNVAMMNKRAANLSALTDENLGSLTAADGQNKASALLQRVLDAIREFQETVEPLVLSALVESLQRFLDSAKTDAGYRKRLLRLIRVDVVRALIRPLQVFALSGGVAALQHGKGGVFDEEKSRTNALEWSEALEKICRLLMVLSTRDIDISDSKFSLKFRLTGMLQQLATLVTSPDSHGSTKTKQNLVTLLSHAAKSARNAQYLGRYQDFPLKLLKCLLASINLTEGFELTIDYCEALYFVIRNRKNKMQMIENNAIELLLDELKTILVDKRHLVSPSVLELSLRVLACLRQLARLKAGRLRLVHSGALEFCERAIRAVAPKCLAPMPTVTTTHEPSATDTRLKLLSSLSALSMRCLPVQDYPLAKRTYPLRHKLPSNAPPTSGEQDKAFPESDEDDADGDDVAADFTASEPALAASDDEADPDSSSFPSPQKTKAADLKQYTGFFAEYSRRRGRPTSPAVNGRDEAVDHSSFCRLHARCSNETATLLPVVKVAFPEWIDGYPDLPLQPLKHFPYAFSEKVAAEVARHRSEEKFTPCVVYDLDEIVALSAVGDVSVRRIGLGNEDLDSIGVGSKSVDCLEFESRFESGNLRRATQVGQRDYQLCLSPDVNQQRPHHQWFYFQVSNNEAELPYNFEIINCVKSTSMFGSGSSQ